MDSLTNAIASSDDTLWLDLAGNITAGAGGLSDFVRRALAKAWFQENLPRLRELLCGQRSIQAFDHEHQELITLIAAVFDLLAPTYGAPTAATLAVLAQRYGLSKLCA